MVWSYINPYREPHQPIFRPYVTGPLQQVAAPVGQVVTLAEAKAHAWIDFDQTLDDPLVVELIDAATEFCERAINGHRQLLSVVYNLPVQHLQFWAAGFRFPRPPLQGGVVVTYYDGSGNLQTLAPSYYLVQYPQWQPGMIERAPFVMWPAVQCDRHYPMNVQFTCGYGPGTSIASAISAGSQTVTPASMQGILPPAGTAPNAYQGTQLVIDAGTTNREIVTVTATSSTTFTATFAKAHPGPLPIPVSPNIPRTVRQAILMLVRHWYGNRAAAVAGQVPKEMDLAVKGLLASADWGSYA